jgi:hypothetical protein
MAQTLAPVSAPAGRTQDWRRQMLSPELLIAFSLGCRIVMLLWMISEGIETQHTSLVVSDIARYRDIAQSPGVPYRDFAVEFPPVTLVLLYLTGQGSLLTSYLLVIFSQFVCELVAVFYVGRLTGRAGAAYLLVLNLPLVMLLYRRIDLLTVALVAAGLFHALRASQRRGGTLLGLAVLGKLWPLVLLPLLDLRRSARAVWWAGGTVVVVTAAWVAMVGLQGPQQVLTFRGATGWQVESLVGNWHLLFTDAPVEWQSGAHRVGVVSVVGRLAMLFATGVTILLVAWAVWRREASAIFAGGGAAVLLFLCFAPLLSPQYMGWVTLVVALAAAVVADPVRRQTLLLTGFLVCAATTAVYPSLYDALLRRELLPVALLTVRNLLLCALLVLLVGRLLDVRGRQQPAAP